MAICWKKKMGENEGICRVEPTIQDLRELCLEMQIRSPKTGLESFRRISERKMKGKARKLTFLKTAHHMSYTSKLQILPPLKSALSGQH